MIGAAGPFAQGQPARIVKVYFLARTSILVGTYAA